MHAFTCQIHWEDTRADKEELDWVSPWEVQIDNLPLEAQRTPESVSSIPAAPPRFNLNVSENTRNARIGVVIRDVESGSIVPSSEITSVEVEATTAAEDNTEAQNENIHAGTVIRGNNAHHTGSIKLFGKILSYNVSP